MIYTSFSLNGAWEMGYQEEKYTEEKEPFQSLQKEEDAAGTEPESGNATGRDDRTYSCAGKH